MGAQLLRLLQAIDVHEVEVGLRLAQYVGAIVCVDRAHYARKIHNYLLVLQLLQRDLLGSRYHQIDYVLVGRVLVVESAVLAHPDQALVVQVEVLSKQCSVAQRVEILTHRRYLCLDLLLQSVVECESGYVLRNHIRRVYHIGI